MIRVRAEAAPERFSQIARLLNASPFTGQIGHWFLHASAEGPAPDFAVAIPAKDEEERIVPCLDACRTAIEKSGRPGRIVLLVNNTADRTVALALAWSREHRWPIDILEVGFKDRIAHAGGARRLAMDYARLCLGPSGAVMTTDADSSPDPDWARANLRGLECGAGLVCGRIVLDSGEASRLPASIVALGDAEGAYSAAARRLIDRIDPDPHNPGAHHGNASGASLALVAATYDLIGGLPCLVHSEDRALAAAVKEVDLPVVYSDEARVVTSGRLDGRAVGGMADTIGTRIAEDDPWCDQHLESADATFLRASVRARLRRFAGQPMQIHGFLTNLGLSEADRLRAQALPHTGKLIACAESASPLLARRRLRCSDLPREHARLTRVLDCVERNPDSIRLAVSAPLAAPAREALPW